MCVDFPVPLFAAKDDPFARFHTNQGLVNFIVAIIAGALSAIPFIGIVFSVVAFVTFIFQIIGIINVCKGETKALPLIGGIQLIK